jgi:hypothetical protein
MSFELVIRVHKDDMTLIGNLIGLDEHPVEEGSTVIFVPTQPSCDFVLVRWTPDDDDLTLTPDLDALDTYVDLLRAKLADLRHTLDLRPRRRRARKLREQITVMERVLAAFEAAKKGDTS